MEGRTETQKLFSHSMEFVIHNTDKTHATWQLINLICDVQFQIGTDKTQTKIVVPRSTYNLQKKYKNYKMGLKYPTKNKNKNTCQEFIFYITGTNTSPCIFYISSTFEHNEKEENKLE